MLLISSFAAAMVVALAMGFAEKTRMARVREREWHRWLGGTLRSFGAGVITTDIDGRVTLMNTTAEWLTGWNEREATGRPVGSIFRLLDESTRRPVVNPAAKALYRRAIVGPSPRTVLIARHGVEHYVHDTTAPMCDDHGRPFGCVLIFRPVSVPIQPSGC